MSIFYTYFKGQTPETRFFAIRFLSEFSDNKHVQLSVLELSRRLAVSKNTVTTGMAWMVTKECLEPCLKSQFGRRHPNKYKIMENSRELQEVIEKEFRASPHEGAIRLLVSPRLNDQLQLLPSEMVDKLQLANLLFMAMLFLLADSTGVAWGLSQKTIRELTGMSNNRIRSQLDTLRKYGFLEHVYSGGSGKVLFGLESSIFYIRREYCPLSRSAWKGRNVEVCLKKFFAFMKAIVTQLSAPSQKNKDALLLMGFGVEIGEALEKFSKLLHFKANDWEMAHLEQIHDRWAARVLTEHFESAFPPRAAQMPDWLTGEIQQTLFPRTLLGSYKVKQGPNPLSDNELEMISSYIAKSVVEHANDLILVIDNPTHNLFRIESSSRDRKLFYC